ncbi:2-iminoacetate synthase ThiH [Verrucomicrobia bacterium LW23]|nr:2-iminoacetate synthase ThiH [Verrucomicrobia bacterium LW23]
MTFADAFSASLHSGHYSAGGLYRSPLMQRFARMLEPKSPRELEAMAREAQVVTRQHFGRTMRLFAPLYLSNECINVCKYCGFSRDNPILRVTLALDQVEAEARHLAAQGFRNILLVAGEHPKFVSRNYLADCVARLRPFIPGISLEVAPMETEDYLPMVEAGAEGLVVYQETYQPEPYAELHVAGPKRDFLWRMACPERAYAAGFRRLGIGALFGLAPWRDEAMAVAAHTEWLLKHCWKAQVTISLPRMRPAAGEFEPRYLLPDKEMVQLIAALRICFPQAGLVLSTREPAPLRDGLMPLGITLMSAGSHTEPGGYTGAGKDALHRTQKGRHIALTEEETRDGAPELSATEQFHISDDRTPAEIARKLRTLGLEPVWKDWDAGILCEAEAAEAAA